MSHEETPSPSQSVVLNHDEKLSQLALLECLELIRQCLNDSLKRPGNLAPELQRLLARLGVRLSFALRTSFDLQSLTSSERLELEQVAVLSRGLLSLEARLSAQLSRPSLPSH